MTKRLIVIGSGGHAKVVIDTLRVLGRVPLGIIDPNQNRGAISLFGLIVLGDDAAVLDYSADDIELVNGIGSLPNMNLRSSLAQRFSDAGFNFFTMVHPSAFVSDDVSLAAGVQVMAGATIQSGCQISNDCIVNTNACVDHDCNLAAHVHVSPGATLCGEVQVGHNVHIGSGSVVIQGLTIGANTVIGAGCCN